MIPAFVSKMSHSWSDFVSRKTYICIIFCNRNKNKQLVVVVVIFDVLVVVVSAIWSCVRSWGNFREMRQSCLGNCLNGKVNPPCCRCRHFRCICGLVWCQELRVSGHLSHFCKSASTSSKSAPTNQPKTCSVQQVVESRWLQPIQWCWISWISWISWIR